MAQIGLASINLYIFISETTGSIEARCYMERSLNIIVCLYGPGHLKKWLHYIIRLKKVSNGAKIRNRYNQVPHLTQDTNGKVTNSQKTPQTRAKRSALSQQVTTKHINRRAQNIANTRQNKNIKDPQQKYRLGTVSKIFYWRA